jgi:hypothetical protein
MKLQFQSRPYPGENSRPNPEVHIDEATNSLFVVVPWGKREAAKKVIDRMVEYLAFAAQDKEATSPLSRLTCLSNSANNLRTAALLANDMIFREDNLDEYRSGVELFGATLDQNELSWLQVGGPQLLLGRGSQPFLPLGSNIDLSLDLRDWRSKTELPALPAQLLGLDSHVNLTINSFRARSGDRLVLLNHSRIPEIVFSWKANSLSMDEMVRLLANHSPQSAFWLGVLEVEASPQESQLTNSNLSGDVA